MIVLLTVCMSGLPGQNPGGSMATAAFGRGPTIVLVHGLGSRPEHWLPAARILARRHRVVLVELPGHGEDELGPFSLDVATEALDAAIKAADHRPVVLVGHSIGGLVATNEALRHPETVRRLVIVETALKPQVEGAARGGMLRALDHDYRGVLSNAYRAFGRDSAQSARLLAYAASLDSANMMRWIRLALTADLSQRVATLDTPVLAVINDRTWPWGEPWQVTSDALGYTRVPRLEPERIGNCGHFVMLDQPLILAVAIERFITQPRRESLALR